jgi:amidohydrolase
MKELILKEIEGIKERLHNISVFMYNNPETGNQEFKAVDKLTKFLNENGFEVEIGITGRPTAFKAVYDSNIPGPAVAYLCEYDALPGIGHGCGHNMIGTMSAGAAVALSKVLNKTGGKIVVFGTPAEETDGGKVYMTEQGVFNEVDVAMILHPAEVSYESGSSLAMDAIQFDFRGKTSHAAAEPEVGINALDAAILTFNGINALRQHVTSDVRIHGIIKEGGVAANIVPERAVAQFYVRAAQRKYLDEVVEKVKNVARGAALMTGAQLEISNYEISYDNMNTNKVLSQVFTNNLKHIGITDVVTQRSGYGSIDMGNVSRVVPSIHPYIGLDCPNIAGHTREMADMTISERGHRALVDGAVALALTGYDVLTNKELLEEIKMEFNSTK